MTITALSVIQHATETLQDPTSVRWPVDELVRYLNDGQREIVVHRPDAMVTNASLTLTAGTKQALPAGAAKLIEVVRNTSSSNKKAVRLINREILDAQVPDWHNLTGVTEVLHFMYDPRDPLVFYVYPPVSSGSVEIVYAKLPTDIAQPGVGTLYTAVTGNISVPDIFANPLLDYILYRSYSKDAEYAANGARATAHYAAFANTLGIEIKATVAVGPATLNNPNVPRPASAVAG